MRSFLNEKTGMNQYRLLVVDGYGTREYPCLWLGHDRYRCGHCEFGYFSATQNGAEPQRCPECDYLILVRFDGW